MRRTRIPYTKGPWFVTRANPYWIGFGVVPLKENKHNPQGAICRVTPDDLYGDPQFGEDPESPQAQINAKVLAVAPDTLEVCYMIMEGASREELERAAEAALKVAEEGRYIDV